MKTGIRVLQGTASDMAVESESVDLVVTSPPYPMVEMWDGVFALQESQITGYLAAGDGDRAFGLMHRVLDKAWAESYRVLKDGGLACINIGDATRSLNGDFRLYSNHARILQYCHQLGFVSLPDILWRKPTNAPNKFMGSGMLPVGAYVTYEHEYILVLRKGGRRAFKTAEDKGRRRRSAFFWEERNVWFSDIWFDIRGAGQELVEKETRQRSAAFPFELAYRLVSMFSVAGDAVLDPFVGTGTTLAAALACGRHATGVELEGALVPAICDLLRSMPEAANGYNRERLARHLRFVEKRTLEKGPFKYTNAHYGFPVVTAQEKELVIPRVESVRRVGDADFEVDYSAAPLSASNACTASMPAKVSDSPPQCSTVRGPV